MLVWSSNPVWEGTRKGYKEKTTNRILCKFSPEAVYHKVCKLCGQTYLDLPDLFMWSKPGYLNLRLIYKANTLQLHQRTTEMTNAWSIHGIIRCLGTVVSYTITLSFQASQVPIRLYRNTILTTKSTCSGRQMAMNYIWNSAIQFYF